MGSFFKKSILLLFLIAPQWALAQSSSSIPWGTGAEGFHTYAHIYRGETLSIFQMNDQLQVRAYLNIPVRVEQESCEGVNTMAFMLDAKGTFANGTLSSLKGISVQDLFTRYQGKASGGAVIGGYARWSSVAANGARISDSQAALPVPIGGGDVALPVPIGGGDVALGYTNCRTSFVIVPNGPVEYSSPTAGIEKTTVDFKDVANLPLSN